MKQTRLVISLVLLAVISAGSSMAQTGSIGVNLQSNPYGFGPFSVGPTFASAYGVAAGDWYNAFADAGAPASGGFSAGPFAFSSPAMNSGSTMVSWSGAGEYCAFGYCYANQPGGNNPTTGEEAVLSGTIFGTAPPNTQGNLPIVVTISGLNSFAANYTVELIAAEDDGEGFQPVQISDGTTSEQINFSNVSQGGMYNTTRTSPMSTATSVNTYTGGTLTVTVAGEDGGATDNPRIRNALAGVVINFTTGVSSGPAVSIANVGGSIQVTWSGGTLLAASNVAGPYTAVSSPPNPYIPAPGSKAQFFRVSSP